MVFFWRKNRQEGPEVESPSLLAPTIHSSSSYYSSSSSSSAFSSIYPQNALLRMRPSSAKCSLVDPRETDDLCSASPIDPHNALPLPIHSSSERSSVDPSEIERPPCPPSSYSFPIGPQNALPALKPPFANCPLVDLREAEPPVCPSSSSSSWSSSSSPRLSSFDESDLPKHVFPHGEADEPITNQASPCEATEETLLTVPGAIIHLIDESQSVELAGGDLSIIRLIQSENMIAVFARIADVQWPLAKDEAAVKLDDSHYFFSLRLPAESGSQGSDAADWVLNYGLTFQAERQEKTELDGILQQCSCFSVHSAAKVPGSEPPAKEGAEAAAAAYWTTLAPNVNDYSGLMARAVAVGSGQLVRGIIWCGDVTVERLKWGTIS